MRIPLNKSTIGEEEKSAVRAVLESDRLTMGDRCRAFEQEFADFIGVEHAVLVNSGSSANLIALFGEDYRAYARRTGRSVPRFR